MMSTRTRRHARSPKHSVLHSAHAVSAARAAAQDTDEDAVGDHIGVRIIDAHSAIHRFRAELPGYQGWEWQVVVAAAPGADQVTISEVALVPEPHGEALRAPDWVPYSDRLRPGDLKPGDIMPPEPGDERLTEDPEYSATIATDADRPRAHLERQYFLSRAGLKEATARWRTGEFGPNSEYAEKAPLQCTTCAFYIPLGQPVGTNFGVCANEYAADGHVVHATAGCGAHSEGSTGMEPAERVGNPFDDEVF